MATAYECARCGTSQDGRRLVIEQHATDDSGLQPLVHKCWTLCPPCAEQVMSLVGEVSPWQADARTLVLPT